MKDSSFKETVLKGLPLSEGIAIARVCRFNEIRHQNVDIYRVEKSAVETEVLRVKGAMDATSARLQELQDATARKIGEAEAGIFSAQRAMLDDETVRGQVEALIRERHINAEAAVSRVLNSYEARLREIDNEYISERASDVGELRRRILDKLKNLSPEFMCGIEEHCVRGRDRIVVTDELTPSLTMELDTERTLGFVTEHGGVNSHAAILARALGIPAVTGIPGIHRSISCGTEIVVNGNTGEVIIWPRESTIAELRQVADRKVRLPASVAPVPRLKVRANISLAHEASEAAIEEAEGIGLYRTEFEFIAAGRHLNEDEQYEKYASVVKTMKGLPVTFRLFDAGSDKPVPFLDIPREENPALGWRGARLLLGNKDLLRVQARAIARASRHGPVEILYPMIVDLGQFLSLKEAVESAYEDIRRGEIMHGLMFEVPSACIEPEELLEAADFASIGTNDLVQYMFAVDRNNDLVARYYDTDQKALWKIIASLFSVANSVGKPLSLCGEMAAQPKYVEKLISLGASCLSVSPRLIPGIRNAARGERT